MMKEIFMCLSDDIQVDIIEAFNTNSVWISIILTLKDWSQIYPTELQMNKANSTDIEVPFLDFIGF